MLWRAKPEKPEVSLRKLIDGLRRDTEQVSEIRSDAHAAGLVLDGLGRELACIRRLIRGERPA